MADDLSNRGPQDRSRINMSEEHEVRYWTEALGVSREALQRAWDEMRRGERVGRPRRGVPTVHALRRELAGKRTRPAR